MSNDLSLGTLSARAYTPSQRAEERTNRLRTLLGLESKAQVARLAIGRSLCIPEQPPELEGGGTGTGIKGETLLGREDLKTWVSLVIEHGGLREYSGGTLADLIVRHWDRGCDLLIREWEETQEPRYKRFIESLAKYAALGDGAAGGREPEGTGVNGGLPGISLPIVPVHVQVGPVGLIQGTSEKAIWTPNVPGASPFCAVLGKSGTGKTWTGLHMIRQIRETTNCPTLILDLKGDIASHPDLVAAAGAEVIRPGEKPIPLDALALPASTPEAVERAAGAFRDSLVRVEKLGPKQQMAVRDSLRRLLGAKSRGVSLRDLKNDIAAFYAQNNLAPDSLQALLDDITSIALIEPRLSPPEFFAKNWIVCMQGLPEKQVRMLALILIDSLARYVLNLDEAPQDSAGTRQVRFLLGIDEARIILGLKHESLVNLVRMGRAKGLIGVFMSQSPDDFANESSDYLEQMGLPVVFNTVVDKAKMLEGLFGTKMSALKLGSLQKGHAFVKLLGYTGATDVTCWA